MKIVDVESELCTPVKHSVGQTIQLSNDVIYYEEQLKIIASEIAEAKASIRCLVSPRLRRSRNS